MTCINTQTQLSHWNCLNLDVLVALSPTYLSVDDTSNLSFDRSSFGFLQSLEAESQELDALRDQSLLEDQLSPQLDGGDGSFRNFCAH